MSAVKCRANLNFKAKFTVWQFELSRSLIPQLTANIGQYNCLFEIELVLPPSLQQNENWSLATCSSKFKLNLQIQLGRAGCNLLDSNCQSNYAVPMLRWKFAAKVAIKRTSGLTVSLQYMYSTKTNYFLVQQFSRYAALFLGLAYGYKRNGKTTLYSGITCSSHWLKITFKSCASLKVAHWLQSMLLSCKKPQ